MILNGSSRNFYVPVANLPHVQENSCACVCPKTFSTNQIVGFFKPQYLKKQLVSHNPDCFSCGKILLELTN